MSRKVCFVTGATGAVGPSLVNRLLKSGCHVRALVRGASAASLHPSVELVHGDLFASDSIRVAMRDVDTVFHVAAKLHVADPEQSLQDEYTRVNTEGTALIYHAALDANVRRLVYFSTIAVYGKSIAPENGLTEADRVVPDTMYAASKYRGEQIVMSDPRSVVLRLAAVYGRGMRGNYPRLISAIKKRRYVQVGAGLNRRTLVHVEDVAEAAILAARHESASGQVFNVTDGRAWTLQEIVQAICAAEGIAPPRARIPQRPVRIVAGLLEDTLRCVGMRSPIRRSTIDKLLEDVAVSGEKIQRELGFRPKYDLFAGWKDAIQDKAA